MMMIDYLIYSLETGEIVRRLRCSIGPTRRANVQDGEGAVPAGDTEGVPDAIYRVDLATKQLVRKDD